LLAGFFAPDALNLRIEGFRGSSGLFFAAFCPMGSFAFVARFFLGIVLLRSQMVQRRRFLEM